MARGPRSPVWCWRSREGFRPRRKTASHPRIPVPRIRRPALRRPRRTALLGVTILSLAVASLVTGAGPAGGRAAGEAAAGRRGCDLGSAGRSLGRGRLLRRGPGRGAPKSAHPERRPGRAREGPPRARGGAGRAAHRHRLLLPAARQRQAPENAARRDVRQPAALLADGPGRRTAHRAGVSARQRGPPAPGGPPRCGTDGPPDRRLLNKVAATQLPVHLPRRATRCPAAA